MEALVEVATIQEYGAVFTKPWMVEFMLDLCGYTADRDLAGLRAVEPSCGGGAFLLPMVERVSASCHERGLDIADASQAIQAFDLQAEHVDRCRSAVERWLSEEGWPQATATHLAEQWVHLDDYLLRGPAEAGVDLVIGNPPYIRAEAIPRDLRADYVARCSTMTEGSDIYVGFFEVGLRSLKQGGVLCFICADRWMRNGYGRKLRRLVADGFDMRAVYEMHGVDAFAQEVSAYPAVTLIGRGSQGEVRYVSAQATFDAEAASRLEAWSSDGSRPIEDRDFTATVLEDWFHTDAHWPTGTPQSLSLLRKLEAQYPTLEETGAKVGIGVATGADSVFVTHDESVAERERLLPLVTTSDIAGGRIEWHHAWLVNPWNADGSLVSLKDHPQLESYLGAHRARLSGRHVARKGPAAWYRTIDKVIPGLRERQKLLFQDMKMTIQPVLDEGGYYPHHNLYWVTSDEWDLKVLGGILLSRVAQFFVSSYAVRMRGGTLRFQAQYLRRIRLPRPEEIAPDVARRLAVAFSTRDVEAATAAALEAYGIEQVPS